MAYGNVRQPADIVEGQSFSAKSTMDTFLNMMLVSNVHQRPRSFSLCRPANRFLLDMTQTSGAVYWWVISQCRDCFMASADESSGAEGSLVNGSLTSRNLSTCFFWILGKLFDPASGWKCSP